MTLLREVTERPLDPGYAAAAAERAARAEAATTGAGAGDGAGAGWRWSRRAGGTAAAAVLAGLLLTAAVLQLRVPAPAGDRAALLQQIQERTAAADRAAAQAEALRAQVAAVQERALAGEPDAPQADPGLLVASGSAPVTGPGLVVTLDDGPSPDGAASDDPRAPSDGLHRVSYLDLQVTANGLWSAGAEAVAINGERLTGTTAIRNAGSAVLVNFRPLSPPYRVEAIGDPNALAARFALSRASSWLTQAQRDVGLGVALQAAEELDLPAHQQQQLSYARALPDGVDVPVDVPAAEPADVPAAEEALP
ncbi:Uncharacterized conserved protein YlxW, UPF0749 family [Quadrisphaera sp. DSM 44207]|nr:Uncharacterized conserved protein YlxW, UPF0749 family [Quadrisphaera sp. DSM 44207]